MFRGLGYEECASPVYEPGYLKIAIYAEGQEFQHVAKQLRSGDWSSKGGVFHDFRHDSLEALEDSGVLKRATPVRFMRRGDDGTDMALEETGLILPSS